MTTRRALLAATGATLIAGCTGGQSASPPPSPRPASRLALDRAGGGDAPPLTAHRPVELVVDTDGVWANPFDPEQVDLRVTLTGPGGESLTVPAFWYQQYAGGGARADGPPGWRARATLTASGDWTATATLAGADLTSEPLSLPVGAAADPRGFIRLDPHGTGFAYDDGTTFLPVGANICWSRAPQEQWLGDYQRWFSRLAAAGGNAARLWMAPWGFSIEWDDTPLGDYTNRLGRAWYLDQVFALAEEHDIRIMLALLNHGQFSATTDPQWHENPHNAANGGPLETPEQFTTDPLALALFERRLRYVAARWACFPSLWAWEWWNEVQWTPIGEPALAEWIRRMTPVLHEHDPYRHLVTNSQASGSRLWGELPELDFATEHIYSRTDPVRAWPREVPEVLTRAAGKPVVLAEFGAGAADDAEIDAEGIHWHNGLWAAPFTGYSGPAMYWWWDEYLDPNDLWEQVRGISAFLAGEELAGYTPVRPEATGGAVALGLHQPERMLVWIRAEDYQIEVVHRAYDDAAREALRSGEPLRFDYQPPRVSGAQLTVGGLTDGPWRATWLSTEDGSTVATDPVTVAAGSATLAVPDFVRDLALKLRV